MDIVRYDPFRRLTSLRDNINRLFDLNFPWEEGRPMELAGWRPTVDIYDSNGETVIQAELPGVKKEDISVDVKDNVLTITGQRSKEEEIKEENYYRQERRFGSFQRAFTLPGEVDPENVKAEFKDGILKVRIPKPREPQTKKITIG
jgi:HSP20 family protein